MPTDSPARPVLLAFLGASNLARGYTALSHFLARGLAPHPVECLAAMGPGRGYVASGGLWNITYPPIAQCGLLEAVRERAASGRNVAAFVTDIGNDIMYGVPADEIIGCLDKIFQTFDAVAGQVLVTPIPLDLEKDIGPGTFRRLRALYFPRSQVTLAQATRAVNEINAFIRTCRLARVHPLEGMEAFRGFDKIHYAVLRNAPAWTRVGEEMLHLFQARPRFPRRIGCGRMLHSFGCNAGRLIFMDALRLRPRPGALY